MTPRTTGLVAFSLAFAVLSGPRARADDRSDILAVLGRVEDGFSTYDAPKVASAYAADADWLNPFGVHLVGREQIQKFLIRLFAKAGYRSGKNTSQIVTEVQFVTPDVAIGHGFEQSAGQVDDETGRKMDPRKSHYLDVLAKRDGHWVIVSEMIMDEK
jgi:uncharacterized protein (TIGR02246 family)